MILLRSKRIKCIGISAILIVAIVLLILYLIYAKQTNAIVVSYSNMKEITHNEAMGNLEKYITVRKVGEAQYSLTLYDTKQQTVFEAEYPKEPVPEFIDGRLIQVTVSLGSPNRYQFFYDIVDGNLSDVYYNPLLVQDSKILYMDDERKLIYRDIFDPAVVYSEIVRDFSPTAEPSNAVIHAVVEHDTLDIEYFEGPGLIERKESIKLPVTNRDEL